jgi:anti-anti-sigma factor
VDLAGLTFMDSSGLHLLEALAGRARARGGRFEVRGATGGVARLLALAA